MTRGVDGYVEEMTGRRTGHSTVRARDRGAREAEKIAANFEGWVPTGTAFEKAKKLGLDIPPDIKKEDLEAMISQATDRASVANLDQFIIDNNIKPGREVEFVFVKTVKSRSVEKIMKVRILQVDKSNVELLNLETQAKKWFRIDNPAIRWD